MLCKRNRSEILLQNIALCGFIRLTWEKQSVYLSHSNLCLFEKNKQDI